MEEHKRLYEEALVKEIMISTALCIQELVQDDSSLNEEDICNFMDENFKSIIEDTLSSNIDEEDATDDWKDE